MYIKVFRMEEDDTDAYVAMVTATSFWSEGATEAEAIANLMADVDSEHHFLDSYRDRLSHRMAATLDYYDRWQPVNPDGSRWPADDGCPGRAAVVVG